MKKTIVAYIGLLLMGMVNSPLVKAQDEIPGSGNITVAHVTLQPDAMLVQHWAMPTLLDPSATGDTDFIRIRGGARMEYFGSHESPKSYLATADSPFKLMGKRIGAGVVVNSQSYGLYRNLLIGAQGSYKLQIKSSRLSIGVQVGYFHSQFKGSELVIYNRPEDNENNGEEEGGEDEGTDNFDTDLPTQDVKAGMFDLGVGIRYDHPKFHVGVAAQHLMSPTLRLTRDGETTTDTRYMEAKLPMTLYFDAGGNIDINNSLFTLQPSVLVGSDFSNIDAVVEMRATYNRKVTFGVDYRYNRAAGVLAGLILKDFYIGYAWEYDYKTSPKGSTGNHELVLGYQFKMDMGGKNTYSHRSIRIM